MNESRMRMTVNIEGRNTSNVNLKMSLCTYVYYFITSPIRLQSYSNDGRTHA